ncbi:peptidase propeptide and YPEB domain protein [bacterium BMS3Abin07]|nr:peptidase propeptide and YPEB domain protein [bacterium BMS3Abin07]GBE32869.1 peptidase propeptide and YPEB domain protein [bacterium BMS3Bbin05]HDO23009.1 peptidase M4 [Nitrospirota bacterium]HDZ87522.1 peptidase M4 [Nitrospirota bacterium]
MGRFGTVIWIILAGLLTFGGIALSAEQANHTGSIRIKQEDEAGFAGMAKISLDSAMNAALQAVPGKVLRAELENENSYLVYGVEIVKADRRVVDVKIDAGNGKVLKIDRDRRDNEGRESEDSNDGHGEESER